jgi:hypothetical protein
MLRFLRMRLRHHPRRAPLALAGLLFVALGAASPAFAQNDDDELVPPNVRVSIAQGSGARALGMGGAFLARPDDGTAASWNPAGLSYLRRLEVSFAGLKTSARAVGRVAETGEIDNEDRLEAMTADFVSAAFPFESEAISGAGQLSFHRAIPFGARRQLNRSRHRAVNLKTDGGFDVIAAGIGFKLSQSIRFGATVNRWVNGYNAEFRAISLDDSRPPEERDTRMRIRGWNMNAGLIWHPLGDDRLNVGLVGKTPFDADVREKRRQKTFFFDSDPIERAEERDGLNLRFPGSVGFGTSWRISSPLTVSLDYTLGFWSKASIERYFQIAPRGDVVEFPELPFPDISTPSEQENTEQIRMGMEYVLFFGKVKCPVRVGYFNDRQYFRSDLDDPEEARDDGPAPRFNAFTAGTGVAAGRFLFDVAYVQERGRYLDGFQRSTTAHRVYMSVIFRYAGRY